MTGEIENRYGEKFQVPKWIYALLGRSVQISENLEDRTNYPINGSVSSTDGTNYARHTIAVVGHSESTTTTDDRGNFTIKVPPGNYLVSVTNSSGSEVGKFRLVIARGGGVSLQSLSGGFSVTANGVTGVRPNEVAKPVFDPVEGSYSSDQSISITSATSGVTIYYTTDGTDPNISSNLYSSAIPVSGSGTSITIKAIAILDRKRFSPISSGSFTINYNQVSTPTFNVASGTYNSDQSITITSSTSGSTIYYTTDGSTPTTGSTQYSSAISVAGNGTSMTIKAIAVKSGMLDSGVTSGSYTILIPGEINIKIAGTNYASGSSYYFGNFLIGSSNNVTFTIENTTASTSLVITSISGSNSNFIYSSLNTTIEGNSSTNMNVNFNPQSAGLLETTLTINNNDLNESSYTITLRGTGLNDASATCGAIGTSGDKMLLISDPNTRYDGNLGGVSGADTKCSNATNVAKYSGKTFKTMIGATTRNKNTDWVLLPNTRYFNSEGNCVCKTDASAVPITFHTYIYTPSYDVHTGLNSDFTTASNTCNNWTINSIGVHGNFGNSDVDLTLYPSNQMYSNATPPGIIKCSFSKFLYCVEQ